MNDKYIAGSIERFQERFTFGGLVGVVAFKKIDPSAWEVSDFLKQELQAIAEKTREDTLREVSTEVRDMTNNHREGYIAAVVDVRLILANLSRKVKIYEK